MAYVIEDKPTEVVSCELNYISRTVKTSLFIDNKLINTKDLNKKDFRELRKLISAPNYYQEGETEILPDISGYYFDRGNETWYSYKTGIQDPSNKSGVKQSLFNYFENLREQLMKK
jgi:hypothetical protein